MRANWAAGTQLALLSCPSMPMGLRYQEEEKETLVTCPGHPREPQRVTVSLAW